MPWQLFMVLLIVVGWGVGFRMTRRSGLGILLPFGTIVALIILAFAASVHYWWRWVLLVPN